MPATIDPDEHRFSYVTGNNAQTRLNGMVGGGPVAVSPNHWLADVAKEHLPAPAQGKIEITYHLLEWLFLDLLLLPKDVMDLGQGWSFS